MVADRHDKGYSPGPKPEFAPLLWSNHSPPATHCIAAGTIGIQYIT